MSVFKKLFMRLQIDGKSALFTEGNINYKLKISKSRNMKKTLNFLDYFIEMYFF